LLSDRAEGEPPSAPDHRALSPVETSGAAFGLCIVTAERSSGSQRLARTREHVVDAFAFVIQAGPLLTVQNHDRRDDGKHGDGNPQISRLVDGTLTQGGW
jgi:hypothetical protein